ncbi:hypothetical protein BKA70DRAFT_1294637 [Coprinopsis sp. MPI-PUGE-AT-0042]|nr:hypothetical protein BKA70DRAFT_1294637 [Coprinopsis sp. MPI-PUGE-AT-0042]
MTDVPKLTSTIYSSITRCPSALPVQLWLGQTALFAMNGIVIKRVVCLWSGDKRVLWALMIALATLAVLSTIVVILASDIRGVVERIQSVNLHEMCVILPVHFSSWHWTSAVAVLVFDALVFGLSVVQGIRFACENRRIDNGKKVGIIEHLWSTRQTLASVLLRDSILFPVINLILQMLIISTWIVNAPPGWVLSVVVAVVVAIPVLGCRLLLNLRTACYKPFREEFFRSQKQYGSLVFPNWSLESARHEEQR